MGTEETLIIAELGALVLALENVFQAIDRKDKFLINVNTKEAYYSDNVKTLYPNEKGRN